MNLSKVIKQNYISIILFLIILVLIYLIFRLLIANDTIINKNEGFEDNKIGKKVFITFGAGGQNFYDATKRLTDQARSLDVFDEIIAYDDNYLKNDNEFWDKHGNFIENNKRGYGYWLWKPYVIKKTMEKLADGNVLMYLDCGCEIDINKKDKILEYFELVKKYNIICTDTGYVEKDWNKMDLVLKLEMLDEKHMSSNQYQAGAQLIYINDITRKLVNEWYNIASEYHNIDDSPSVAKNCDSFKEHRHDQSIFSLLLKKNNLGTNDVSLFNCIEIIRNKNGQTKIENK